MNILPITDKKFTDRYWESYYKLIIDLNEKYNSSAKRIGWENHKKTIQSLAKSDPDYYRFVVFDNDIAVGWADLNVMSPNTSEQIVSIRLDFNYEQAPAEFEKLIASEYLRILKERNSKTAHFMANDQRRSLIARNWFSKELNRLDLYLLNREDADITLMKSWLENIPLANQEMRIEFHDPVPEKHLVRHTELFVDYIKEMPSERESEKPFLLSVDEIRRDMKWRTKNKIHIYTYILFDKNNSMIGHSNAVITEADPTDVYQAITGINSDYRGKGLSKWLKAALFFKIGQDFPGNKTMTTEMRAVNAPMQKVNKEMGYQLQAQGYEFDISVEGLQKFIAQN